MKRLTIIAAALIITASLFAGCTTPDAATEPTAAIKVTAAPTANSTPEPTKEPLTGEMIKTTYTQSFSIMDYGNDIKLVTDADGQKFFLVPKTMDEVPELPEEATDAMLIRTPIDNAVFGSATQLGTLVAIMTPELLDTVGAVTSGAGTWYIDEIESRIADGTIKYVGGDMGVDPDYEAIAALEPEMVFIYTGDYGQMSVQAKMAELNIACSTDNEYIETDYMARLEWIKFLAAFYNLDKEADAFIKEQEIIKVKIIDEVKDLEKPKVIWGNIWEGVMYVTSPTGYVAQMIEDAGGDNVFKDEDYSMGITLEELYKQAKDADIIIYSSSAAWLMNPSVEGIIELAPVLEDTKPIIDGAVYIMDDDYYTATYKSLVGLQDMAAIFHPDEYPDWELDLFVKLPSTLE